MEEQNLINEQNLTKELSLPIFQAKTWLKLLGVVMIAQGLLTALTIVGIIICWLPIWLGILLFQAANSIEGAQLTGSKEHLIQSLSKLKMYFIINGILMMIFISFALIAILISGGAIFSMMNNM